MKSLLTNISAILTRAFQIAALFPGTVFVTANLLFILPLLPSLSTLDQLTQLEPGWKVALVGMASVIVGFALTSLNFPLLRFYEGYAFRESLLGQILIEWHRYQYGRLEKRQSELDGPESAFVEEILTTQFPPDPTYVTPTRLGNVMAAFEWYPRLKYGMDTAILWPRLTFMLNSEESQPIEYDKMSLDFMINMSFLSFIFGLEYVAVSVYFSLLLPQQLLLAAFLLLVIVPYLFYRASIPNAEAWGVMIRTAFDLYKDRLRSALRLRIPCSIHDERRIWQGVSSFFHTLNEEEVSRDFLYSPDPASSERSVVVTKRVKQVTRDEAALSAVYELVVTHDDPERDTISSILIIDHAHPRGILEAGRLEVGPDVRWISPYSSDPATGTFWWRIEDLDRGSKAKLTYRVVTPIAKS